MNGMTLTLEPLVQVYGTSPYLYITVCISTYRQTDIHMYMYSTNHVYLHRPNAFGFWQMRLHLCYETLKRISNFSELA